MAREEPEPLLLASWLAGWPAANLASCHPPPAADVVVVCFVAIALPFFSDFVGLIGALGFWPGAGPRAAPCSRGRRLVQGGEGDLLHGGLQRGQRMPQCRHVHMLQLALHSVPYGCIGPVACTCMRMPPRPYVL